jgi:acetyl-CoA carboxylase carboxyltransferase component
MKLVVQAVASLRVAPKRRGTANFYAHTEVSRGKKCATEISSSMWRSSVNRQSEQFKQNYADMSTLVERLQSILDESALSQGRNKDVNRHLSRGQLLCRDRIELLLDQGTPFLELMPLAGFEQDGVPTGASVVAGLGLIGGVECMITANVPTLAGGAINEVSVQKSARIHEICMQNRLPCINLTQSAGANLAKQFQVFHPGGASFRHLAERSKANIPTATIVFGSSTAG